MSPVCYGVGSKPLLCHTYPLCQPSHSCLVGCQRGWLFLDACSWEDGPDTVLVFLLADWQGAASPEDAPALFQWFSLAVGSDVKGVPSDPYFFISKAL